MIHRMDISNKKTGVDNKGLIVKSSEFLTFSHLCLPNNPYFIIVDAKINSKTGIDQPIFISSCYYNFQSFRKWSRSLIIDIYTD